jgi:hypothetical protein
LNDVSALRISASQQTAGQQRFFCCPGFSEHSREFPTCGAASRLHVDASRYPFYYFSAFLVFSSLFFCSLFWLLAARLIGARFVSPKFKSISIFRAATSYLLSAICACVGEPGGFFSLSALSGCV